MTKAIRVLTKQLTAAKSEAAHFRYLHDLACRALNSYGEYCDALKSTVEQVVDAKEPLEQVVDAVRSSLELADAALAKMPASRGELAGLLSDMRGAIASLPNEQDSPPAATPAELP